MAEAARVEHQEEIPRHVFRFIEGELYHYQGNLRRIERMTAEVAERAKGFSIGTAVRTSGSDPVLNAVSRLGRERELIYLEKRTATIEASMELLPEKCQQLVRLRYWRHKNNRESADQMGVSLATFHRWRMDVIRVFAEQFGIL